MDQIGEKELQVLGEISRNPAISQRELSRTTGISLGLVNIILKRFLKSGYLQVSNLNKRKLQYLLTTKGFMLVTRRTYRYLTRTIKEYWELHEQLTDLLAQLYNDGHRNFYIHGDGELRELVYKILEGISSDNDRIDLANEELTQDNQLILNLSSEPIQKKFNRPVIDILSRIEGFNGMGNL